jgi:hypothetical protein
MGCWLLLLKAGQAKSIMKKISFAIVASASFLLVGCQTPAIHAVNQVVNFGTGLPDEMQGRNISAAVAFDETWAGDYSYAARNQIYSQGVASGTPEYGLRLVRINMRHTDWGLGYRQGSKVWYTAAYVPDHIAPLKAGDFVEIRQTGGWKTMQDFHATGEGNMVLRPLCLVADLGYRECVEKLPRIADYWGFGATGTKYPPNAKEYGFSFSAKYDQQGQAIRP